MTLPLPAFLPSLCKWPPPPLPTNKSTGPVLSFWSEATPVREIRKAKTPLPPRRWVAPKSKIFIPRRATLAEASPLGARGIGLSLLDGFLFSPFTKFSIVNCHHFLAQCLVVRRYFEMFAVWKVTSFWLSMYVCVGCWLSMYVRVLVDRRCVCVCWLNKFIIYLILFKIFNNFKFI